MDMMTDPTNSSGRVAAATNHIQQMYRSTRSRTGSCGYDRLPQTSTTRLEASRVELTSESLDHLDSSGGNKQTVLYLAYGSNLSNETFRGNRGIKPISQINVQVPTLRLTFDLPGIPYAEPCFANSGRRDPRNDPPRPQSSSDASNEKTALLSKREDYHKDRWHKGLIGVVYEVTPEDYAHIIATEGGGSSYHDILVDCHPFHTLDPRSPVPQNPTLPPFKAHTLFAPASPPGEDPPKDGGRFQRPDISYAQPSARYLKLITDGAAELGLPYEYQDYLHSIRPYTITTNKQRMGSWIFLGIWGPIITICFMLNRMFQDEDGRAPIWVREFLGAVFKAAWASYDAFFASVFGDGERTITDGGHDIDDNDSIEQSRRRLSPSWQRKAQEIDVEKAET